MSRTAAGAFPELEQLDLSPTVLDRVGASNVSDELALCTSWFRGCPTLRHIIFPSKTEWALGDNSQWAPVR